MRKLSKKLIAIMLSITSIAALASMPAYSATEVLMNENYNSAAEAPAARWGTSDLVADAKEGKALGLTVPSGGTAAVEYNVVASGGNYTISYSFKAGTGAKPFFAILPAENGATNMDYLGAMDDSKNMYAGGTNAAEKLIRSGLEYDKWYNMEYDLDLDRKRYTAVLTDAYGVVLGKVKASFSKANDIARLRIGAYGNEGTTAAFDNIKIFKQDLADKEVLVEEDFNAYQTVTSAGVNNRTASTMTLGLDAGKNGSGLALKMTATGNWSYIDYDFVTAVPTGKYKVSYMLYAGAGADTRVMLVDAANKTIEAVSMTSGGTLYAGSSTNAISTGCALDRWYEVEMLLDLEAASYTVNVKDPNGNPYTFDQTVIYTTGVNSLTRFRVIVDKTTNATSMIDELKIELPPEETDAIYEEDFDSYNSVAQCTSWNPKTGFTAALDFTDDRTGGNALQITKNTSDMVQIITPNLNYTDGKYVLNFAVKPEAGNDTQMWIQEDGSTYDVAIKVASNGVVTVLGEEIIDSCSFDTWYDVSVDFVLPKGSATVTVTDSSGNVYTKTGTLKSSKLRNLNLVLQDKTESEGSYLAVAALDSVSIFKDDSPVTFTAKADGGAISSVYPSVKEITLTFGQDMDAGTLNKENIYIINKATNEKVSYTSDYADKVYSMTLSEFLATGASYELVVTNAVKTAGGEANLTNSVVPFTTKDVTIEDEDTLIYSDDFSKTLAEAGWGQITMSSASDGVAMFPDTTGYELNSWIMARQNLPNAGDADKVKLSIKFKPGTGVLHMIKFDDKTQPTRLEQMLFSMQDGNVAVGEQYNGTNAITLSEALDTAKWYTAEAVYDRTGKNIAFTLKNDAGTSIGTAEITVLKELTNIHSLHICASVKNESYTIGQYDDLIIEKVFGNPQVKAVSFITADNQEITDVDNVSLLTNRINIDFGTVIDKAYITDEYITLTKDGSTTAVSGFFERNGNIVTLNLTEELEAGEKYNLVIKGAVATQNGLTLGDNSTTAFTIGKGSVKATISAFKVNNEVVDSISDVIEGQSASVEVNYTNSTGEEGKVYLIVCYYINDKLSFVDYISETVAANIKATTLKCDHTIGDTDSIDTIKVFAWDGFDTMHPISAPIVIH